MSVYIRLNSHVGEGERIKKLKDYVFDPCKTNLQYCLTYGVNKESVYQDMLLVKHLYRKTNGRQYLHWVLSFDGEISGEVATQVGREVLLLLDDAFQAIAATHLNTKNKHIHFVINTVNVKTGNKFSESKSDMLNFRDRINQILHKYGLSKIGNVIDRDEDLWNLETEEDGYSVCDDNFMESDMNNNFLLGLPMNQVFSQGMFEVMSVFNGTIFQGKGLTQAENVLIPGVFYEKNPVLPVGVMYDKMTGPDKFKVVQDVDGITYTGNGIIQNGKLLIPGILYEEGV